MSTPDLDTALSATPAESSLAVDRISELYYGEIFTEETAEIARRRIHWMCSQCIGESVLDVGCSQGIACILLAREGINATGLDSHPQAIEYARRATEREPPAVQARIRWIERDLAELSTEQHFDTVLLGEVIEHQALPERFLARAAAFVKRGGRLVLTTPFGLHPHDDHKATLFPSHLAGMAAQLGLDIELLDVADGYIRMTARAADAGRTAIPTSLQELLTATERGTLESQETLYRRLDERGESLKQKIKVGKTLQKRLDEATRKAESAEEVGAKLAQATAQLSASKRREADAEARVEALKGRVADSESQLAEVTARSSRESNASLALRRLEIRVERRRQDAIRHESEWNAVVSKYWEAASLRPSLALQLGQSLIEASRSPGALLRLPATLFKLASHSLARRRARVADRSANQPNQAPERLLDAYDREGIAGFVAAMAAANFTAADEANAFAALAHRLQPVTPALAALAARWAYRCDPRPERAKWLAFRLADASCVSEPAELLARLPPALELSQAERRRAETIRTLSQWSQSLPVPDAGAGAPAYAPDKCSMLYVAPGAYGAGSQLASANERLNALYKNGIKVTAIAPAGSLIARGRGAAELLTRANISRYRRLGELSRTVPLESFIDGGARLIKAAAREQRASVIYVAADVEHSLAALRAARALGIPFIYEARAPADLRRAAKHPGYELTERFRLGTELEGLVARGADHVLAGSEALRQRLLGLGVPIERLSVMPDCVDPQILPTAREARSRSPGGPLVIGYAGPLVAHENVELIIEALARLSARGIAVEARLLGEGPARAALADLASARSVAERVHFYGRLPLNNLLSQLAMLDAVVFPRGSSGAADLACSAELTWCLASGLAVVASDVAAFSSEIEDGVTGRLFKPGDADSLVGALEELALNPDAAALRGAAARVFVERERSSERQADAMRAHIERLVRALPPPRALTDTGQAEGASEETRFEQIYRAGGVTAVIEDVTHRHEGNRAGAARELLTVAKLLGSHGYPEAEYPLAVAAVERDRTESTLRWLYWTAQRAREFVVASETIEQLEKLIGDHPNDRQKELLERFKRSPVTALSALKEARPEPAKVSHIDSVPNRICYVLHNTLPYSSGGYATRSQGVAKGMQSSGWETIVLSRPGFPLDAKPELQPGDVPAFDVVEDIKYVRTLAPLRSPGIRSSAYILDAAAALENRLREHRPALVVAASNYMTALPALIAARRLGLPFIYEIRGFWEVTRVSRDTGYEHNPNYQMQRMTEAAVAREADHVFTLTDAMREELIERGVPADHVDLLPNSCDPVRFHPVARDEALAERLELPTGVPVIGYVGTFVDYEGLEDLASACALLKEQGLEFRLLLVGNENTSGSDRGPISAEIVRIARVHGLTEWLIMPGRVPHEEVESYYSLIDIAPFPRKPWPVCEMVSPLKPLEALAMEKAVVVSSVRALKAMIEDGATGLVFDKGETSSLAAVLRRLIGDPGLRVRLGKAGRAWVARERTWEQVGSSFTEACRPFSDFARRHAGAASESSS